MKVLLISLLVAGIQPWLSKTVAQVDEGRGDVKRRIVVTRLDKARDVFEQAEAEDRGWLGVSIGKVPEALAAQLDIEGQGVIVENVVKDSPADQAGLQVHDVILSVDGEAVEGKTGRTIDLIKVREPGDEVDLVILRNGREQQITVMLGSRADLEDRKITWKREGLPHAEIEERIRTFGRIMRKNDEGDWVIEDLGDLKELKELKDLPRHIRMFMPKSGTRKVTVSVKEDKRNIRIKAERDGNVILVEREGDGEITVTRIDEDGEETVATYQSEEELRDGDEEAYDLFAELDKRVAVHLDIHDESDVIPDVDFDIEVDADEWKTHVEEWKEHLEESLGDARKAYERAMEEFQEQMEQWKSDEGFRKHLRLAPPFRMLLDRENLLRPGPLGKPRHTFEVAEDGTIEVHIRRGDSELIRRYENEDDLAQRSPELFKKYEKLLAADKEAK